MSNKYDYPSLGWPQLTQLILYFFIIVRMHKCIHQQKGQQKFENKVAKRRHLDKSEVWIYIKVSMLRSRLYVWEVKNITKPNKLICKNCKIRAIQRKEFASKFFCKHSIFLNFKDCLQMPVCSFFANCFCVVKSRYFPTFVSNFRQNCK